MTEIVDESHDSQSRFPLVALLVILLALSFFLVLRSQMQLDPPDKLTHLTTAGDAPAIVAAGWLNGPDYTPESFKGKIVVAEGFATWCGPCRDMVPELRSLHEKYSKQGVIFISLTDEGPEDLTAIQQYIDETGMTWPVGYGAYDTLIQLQAEYIPVTWIIDREGRLIKGDALQVQLEEAIELALAGKIKGDDQPAESRDAAAPTTETPGT